MADNVLAAARDLFEEMYRARIFLATVDSKTGGTIKVLRDGQAQAEGVFYAAITGVAASVVAGDRVLVIDGSGNGGFVVIGKVVNV